MAYDKDLADRLRQQMSRHSNVVEKNMFGGIAFMLNGHMCVGVIKDDMVARVGPEAYEAALKQPNAREMDFTKKPMKGSVFVDPEGVEDENDLKRWVGLSEAFALSMPPK